MALKPEHYNTLKRLYDTKQVVARQEAEEKKAEIFRRYPELSALQDKITEKNAERARAAVLLQAYKLTELNVELDLLRKEKAALMSKYGISDSDFLPEYECRDCCDTGFIDGLKCHCFRQAAVNLLYDRSNLREILEKENFRTLTLNYYDRTSENGRKSQYDYMVDKIALCKKYVVDFDEKNDNILLYGPTGTGKTFLSHCIAKELLDSCHSVIYFSAIDLFDACSKAAYSGDVDDQERLDNYLLESDLLIIDDLGSERITAFTTSRLFFIINERINRGKSTLISTNLEPQGLVSTYTERISSRIMSGFTMIELGGSDLRIKKKFG